MSVYMRQMRALTAALLLILGIGFSLSFASQAHAATGGGDGQLAAAQGIAVQEDEVVTAEVDFTSQMSGGFLHAPQFGYEVAGNLAEQYGYTDEVEGGVSALDVLVAAHELVFEDAFTVETATDYLTLDGQTVTKQFGVEFDQDAFYEPSYSHLFFVNHAFPNDGTTHPGLGDWVEYNGTTVATQEVFDGDIVEFFFNEGSFYDDTYSWFLDEDGDYSRSFITEVGDKLNLTLAGNTIPDPAQRAADELEFVNYSSNVSVEDSQVYLVNVETGGLEEIEGAIADEDGNVSLSFDKAGTYTITAYNEDAYMYPLVMTLTTITVTEPIDVTVSISKYGKFVEGENGDPVVQVPVTLYGGLTYTIADALEAVHDECFKGGAEVGYAAAETQYGLGLSKLWGDESGNFAYQVNRGSVSVWGLSDVISDGDEIDAYILQSYYPDSEDYAAFGEAAAEGTAGKPITLQLYSSSFDEFYQMNMIPLAGASVHAYGASADGAPVTDADGKASITLTEPGKQIVTATKTKDVGGQTVTAITAPSCIVTVYPSNESIESLIAAVSAAAADVSQADEWTKEDLEYCLEAAKAILEDEDASDAEKLEAYQSLESALQRAQDSAAAAGVTSAIEGLPANMSSDADIDAVEAAVAAYFALTDDQKDYVSSSTIEALLMAQRKALDARQAALANLQPTAKKDCAMTVQAKTVKAKAKKKTKIKAAKAFTVKGAAGKVSYAKLSGNDKIVVSAAGKVTVKKGLKKNKTYKVKVLVYDAGNAQYAPGAKTVTLKVKVKK